jgi:hypothetical protein
MKILKTLEDVPWFICIGLILTVNLALNLLLDLAGSQAMLWTLLPSVLTQAILYLAVGYVLRTGKYKESFKVFLMSVVFAISNLIVWRNVTEAAMVPSMWILFLVQLALAGIIFTNYKISYFSGSGTWVYATVFVILTASIGGAWVNITGPQVYLQQALWAIAVTATGFGFIVKPADKDKQISTGLYVIGLAVALIAAFALAGPALRLLP